MMNYTELRRSMYTLTRSKDAQMHKDAVVLGSMAIDQLADMKYNGEKYVEDKPIDDFLQEFWTFVFQAENKLGITYDEEVGYIDYPSDIFTS